LSFQTNLFDEGIAEAYVIAHKLKHHKIKMYKSCGHRDCKEEVLNKPSKHFCWLHIMDIVEIHTPLFPVQSVEITSPVLIFS